MSQVPHAAAEWEQVLLLLRGGRDGWRHAGRQCQRDRSVDATPAATREGKYKIERLLGKGGMGAVFLAHDLTLEREVAIKVLPPDISMDEQIVKRFQQEAKTSAKLDHTNIIPIYRV